LDARQIQELLRTRHNLRVGLHTAQYLAARLAAAKMPKVIGVFAADARTGVPLPGKIDPASLRGEKSQLPLFDG
jgi:hypothetical protein